MGYQPEYMGTRRQLSVRKSSRTTILIMKVSIIFLAFFVGASYQQGYYWPYPAPYYQPMYNPYQFGFPAPMAPQQISQGRTKVSASDDTAERNVADDGARLFGNNVIFTFNNLLASTSTTTVTLSPLCLRRLRQRLSLAASHPTNSYPTRPAAEGAPSSKILVSRIILPRPRRKRSRPARFP